MRVRVSFDMEGSAEEGSEPLLGERRDELENFVAMVGGENLLLEPLVETVPLEQPAEEQPAE